MRRLFVLSALVATFAAPLCSPTIAQAATPKPTARLVAGPRIVNLTLHFKGRVRPGTRCAEIYARYVGASGSTRALGTGNAASGVCRFELMSPAAMRGRETGHIYYGTLAAGKLKNTEEEDIKSAFQTIIFSWTGGGITSRDDWNAPK